MNTAKNLQQTSKIVKAILEEEEHARNSDSYLYLKVLYRVGQAKEIDVNAMSVTDFLLHRSELGFPCFETVRRSRQKIQAEHPELSGTNDVEAQRVINERVYRDYARRILNE